MSALLNLLATAILDRLLHSAHVLNIKGRSYRLRDLEDAFKAWPPIFVDEISGVGSMLPTPEIIPFLQRDTS